MSKPTQLIRLDRAKVVEFDARPVLASGGEPFSAIMEAVGSTPADGAFHLLAPFRPTPLFHFLGRKGWFYWIEHGSGDLWDIWFYRPADLELVARIRSENDGWTLDVRGLVPPRPLELTLAALDLLPGGSTLLQINERVPALLLPILSQRGFRYELTHHVTDGTVLLRITTTA